MRSKSLNPLWRTHTCALPILRCVRKDLIPKVSARVPRRHAKSACATTWREHSCLPRRLSSRRLARQKITTEKCVKSEGVRQKLSDIAPSCLPCPHSCQHLCSENVRAFTECERGTQDCVRYRHQRWPI